MSVKLGFPPNIFSLSVGFFFFFYFVNTISNNLKEKSMKKGINNIWKNILVKTGAATRGLIVTK